MIGRFALATMTAAVVVAAGSDVKAQTPTEKNVIYGMYSGLALLMDVYRPAQPNGYGVLFVPGSGWQAPLEYNAVGLKETQLRDWVPPLLLGGRGFIIPNRSRTCSGRFVSCAITRSNTAFSRCLLAPLPGRRALT